jgi:Zn-dependent protease
MYFPKGVLEAGKPGEFSRNEIIHILVAMGTLTLSFSFAFSPLYRFSLERLQTGIPVSFLGIITAFFVHELSHKLVAQKYGLWSEFRMYPFGLLLSLVSGLLTGFVFALPGAVIFRGEPRNFEMGFIAAAGPLANIIIASITSPLYLLFLFETDIGKIVGIICLVNALLATFNLIPLGPLDGAKVIRWNGILWSLLFAVALTIMIIIIPRAPIF